MPMCSTKMLQDQGRDRAADDIHVKTIRARRAVVATTQPESHRLRSCSAYSIRVASCHPATIVIDAVILRHLYSFDRVLYATIVLP